MGMAPQRKVQARLSLWRAPDSRDTFIGHGKKALQVLEWLLIQHTPQDFQHGDCTRLLCPDQENAGMKPSYVAEVQIQGDQKPPVCNDPGPQTLVARAR